MVHRLPLRGDQITSKKQPEVGSVYLDSISVTAPVCQAELPAPHALQSTLLMPYPVPSYYLS